MASRYSQRSLKKLKNSLYYHYLQNRNVNSISHYSTPNQINIPSLQGIKVRQHQWKDGDRFMKLAGKYYNDPTLWWVIAFFNLTPTEGHVVPGQIIQIPFPIEDIVRSIG